MTRVAYLIGTRPEAIRSARILRLLDAAPEAQLTFINTSQHYDHAMMGTFLDELGLPQTSADLNVTDSSPAAQVGLITMRTAEVLWRVRPQVLCVFGDTNSSLAGGLAAVKTGVPLVHIEAGCRSFDMSMPEEVNRRLLDHMGGLLLAVSHVGRTNLEDEAVQGEVQVVGDPQYDVFKETAAHIGAEDPSAPLGLLTLHRPSNVDEPATLGAILGEVEVIGQERGLKWLFPVHPRTRKSIQEVPPSVELCGPQSYGALITLLHRAHVCMTDSGGLQKEALWSRTPCVTVRDTTEWVETVWQGANVLAPPGSDIAEAVRVALDRGDRADFSNPYGDGKTAERVVEAIQTWLQASESAQPYAAPRVRLHKAADAR